MDLLNWFFTLLTILISFIIALSIWSRKKVKYKVLSILLVVFTYLVSYGSLLEILSSNRTCSNIPRLVAALT